MTFNVTESHNGIGITVHNANIAIGLTDAKINFIQDLLYKHRVVVFKDQYLTDEQLTNFTLHFGQLFIADEKNPVLGSAEGCSHVVVIGNRADEYAYSYLGHQEVLPHSDHQWLRCPSSVSVLYAVDVSPEVAPTIWTDMVKSYDLLDDETKEIIKDLKIITYNPFFRPFGSVSAKYVDRRVEIPPGDIFPHPLVRTHSKTGEKLLYLHSAYEMELLDVKYEIGSKLIDHLNKHVQLSNIVYKHTWENGDVVLWDNQATIHYRPFFNQKIRRILKRISVAGEQPY
jgi:taurine dioxygenase